MVTVIEINIIVVTLNSCHLKIVLQMALKYNIIIIS